MITTIKEQRVTVEKSEKGYYWVAVIRGGGVTQIDQIKNYPSYEHIRKYIEFLKEVIEAIKNTAP